ncbi:uncharacterized protein LOC133534053 [Cydia pomonella]|uniref:uncharacterized protein LOC133534053 n=1 Tax=Cydia pomonella TaxID=82600 RepID=UPI002ADE7A8E|nr:uncharacterized protein LOC133534053 [Cydia pomonella]
MSRQLPTGSQFGEQTLAAIDKKVQDALSTIIHVTNTSGHLKGTHQHKLKSSVEAIGGAFAEVRSRTATEEVARLEAANAHLSWQLTELRKQVDEMRSQPAALAEVDIRRIMEEVSRSTRDQFSRMLNARLEGLEGRLLPEPRLRPPLAADRRAVEVAPPQPPAEGSARQPTQQQPAASSTTGPAQPPAVGKQKPKPKNKKGRGVSLAAQEAAAARQASTTSTKETVTAPNKPKWSVVVGSTAKTKTATRAASGSKKSKAPNSPKTPIRKPKLKPPRTAAITITMKPEAVEKGVTYEAILAEAKNRIKLEEIGISTLRFRTAATGARMLELPPDIEDAEKAANELAEKLRGVLGDKANVQRPTKCAELRVTGLDDSVTADEVVTAVATEGGCAPENIKPGVISRSRSGSGSLWLSCPVIAAKKLVGTGRIKVGWISARVVLLESKPLRCYRCLEKGHVGAKCDRDVDRSDLCYRCGMQGHKARECTAEASCAICKASGKPAGHSIGAKGCQGGKSNGAKKGGEHQPLCQCPRPSSTIDGRVANRGSCGIRALFYPLPERLGCRPEQESGYYSPRCHRLSSFESVVKGRGFVLAVLEGIAIIGVYFSPNGILPEFEQSLTEVGALIGQISPVPVLVAGDFNAKSTTWGCPATDPRGEVLEEWAVSLGLAVLNTGSESTCVRPQGESIVDITFASNVLARRVQNWRVEVGVESLSDHRYIRFDLSTPPVTARNTRFTAGDSPKWVLGKLNRELAKEAAIVESWGATIGPVEIAQVERETENLNVALIRVCDAAMPRAKPFSPKRQVYWWRPELRQLRNACVAARRRYTRSRRRRIRVLEEEDALYEAYRIARKTLQTGIAQAKEAAWEEWLETLNRDPWGRPYRAIRKKLRPWAPPLTSSLQPDLLERVVGALFPERGEFVPPAMAPTTRPLEVIREGTTSNRS